MRDDHPLKIKSRLDWARRHQAAETRRAKKSLCQKKMRAAAKAGRASLILKDIEK